MFEYRNIVEPFLSNAQADPDRIAAVYEDTELTYRELDELSMRIACVFRDHGIRPGDRVAYLLPNRIELISVYLAIERMGAVAVPLNFRLIPREIAFLTESVGARMLVFDKRFLDRVRETRPLLDAGVELISVGTSTEFSQRLYDLEIEKEGSCVPLYLGGGLSRIQFTGGSTGVPKGACRTHAADLVEMHAVFASNGMADMPHPVALIQCPLEHHGGHSWFMSSLCVGATVVICGKFDPQSIFDQIDRYGVTHMILLPPTTYLRLVCEGNPARHRTDTLRIVQSAAGGMTPEIVRAVFDAFPNADINYGWGQSESGVGTSLRMTREMLAADDPRIASVGTPMETLEVRIVDDDGADVAPGEAGEAWVRTPAAMTGYWGHDELTAQVFTDGWLHTGDIMQQDARGYLYLRSRKRDIIKSGGENVFINEVQTAILRNPDIADCVVFGTSDPVMGEAVAAVVQPVAGKTLTKEDVQETCKRYIASYKKPRYVVFTDDLGRDDAGKVRTKDVIAYFDSKKKSLAGE